MGSSEVSSLEERHKQKNNVEAHETEPDQILTIKDSGFEQHNTDTLHMTRTPRLIQRSPQMHSQLFKRVRETKDLKDNPASSKQVSTKKPKVV